MDQVVHEKEAWPAKETWGGEAWRCEASPTPALSPLLLPAAVSCGGGSWKPSEEAVKLGDRRSLLGTTAWTQGAKHRVQTSSDWDSWPSGAPFRY